VLRSIGPGVVTGRRWLGVAAGRALGGVGVRSRRVVGRRRLLRRRLAAVLTIGGGQVLRRGIAQDRVNGQLSGLSQRVGGFAGIVDARQLDDDAPVAGTGQRRFGDTEGVD